MIQSSGVFAPVVRVRLKRVAPVNRAGLHVVGTGVALTLCAGRNGLVWRPGSLHGGRLDIQRVLFNLHRRQLPTDVLIAKAEEYVSEGLVAQAEADGMLGVIRSERGTSGIANDAADAGDDAAPAGAPRRLSRDELQALLEKRVGQMKQGGSDDAPTDQFRVYTYIIERLQTGENPLRLMIQASAGTGKSEHAAADACLTSCH